MTRSVRSGLLGLLALFVAGCGTRTYPVEGVVQFAGGKPATVLAGGCVEFEALEGDEGIKGVNARGDIQPDGSFRLKTARLGEGTVEGKHRAIVIPPGPRDDRPAPKVLHPRFQRYESANLQFTVSRDPEQNHFVVEVAGP